MIFDVIVIGAGPAGMLSAGLLGKAGKKVLLLEKRNFPGSKLRITGKGRCNIANDCPVEEFLSNVSPKPKFLKSALSLFYVKELRELFNSLGVATKVERGNRLFPVSDKAEDVVNALHKFCLINDVRINFNTTINHVTKEDEIYTCLDKDKKIYQTKNLVIATGGCSYPVTGSTGDGQKIAQSLGLKVKKLLPGLAPFNTKGELAKSMQGVSLKNVTASVWRDNKKLDEEFGEMMFTHFGVTGPIILTLSNRITTLDDISKLELRIDLKPALDHSKLDERLLREFNQHGKMKFESVLKGLLPKKMISVCAQEIDIPLETLCNQINSNQRKKLKKWLKELILPLQSVRSFKEAIITVGGVALNEISPKSMESKKQPHLYFCGEVLDLHANTGGYNLQIAFSTAYTVASHIIKLT